MAKTPTMAIPSSKVAITLAAGSVEPAMKATGSSSGKMYMVPADKLREIEGFNVRVETPDYLAHRDNIADLIEHNGFDRTKPLSGYVAKEGDENVIYVTDGHTRLSAVQKLNADKDRTSVEKVPVIVHPADISIGELTERLHTANNGRALTPFELGVVVKRRLKDEGVEKAALAGRLGVTPRYLDDVLLLVNSPKAVRTAVLDGSVSATMAIQELRKAGDKPDQAAERITAAVTKAKASGKAKATAKDVGVKMQKVKATVSVADGTDMKEIVKAVAAKVREAIPASVDGDGDDAVKLASVDGTISIVIEVPAPAKPVKAKAEKKPAAKKPAKKAEATSEKKPAAKKPAAKKGENIDVEKSAAGTKAAKDAVLGKGDDDENITADDDAEDIGVEGAEAAEPEIDRTDADLDMPAPPAVKNGEGVDDEEVDI